MSPATPRPLPHPTPDLEPGPTPPPSASPEAAVPRQPAPVTAPPGAEGAEGAGTAATGTARPRRPHRYDIDLLRVLCAGCVIVGHVGGECMQAVGKSAANGGAVYWTGLFLDSVTSWAVPMYFAIAGWAVLVGAPPRNGGTLRKRSLRMVVPVGIWSAVYLLWGWWRETNDRPTAKLALDAVFGTVQPAYHLWYFYVHVPLILLLGFVVLLKAGKRPWGVVAALAVISAGPTALGDVGELTGWDVPDFGWQPGTYSLIYAVVGALLLSLPNRNPASAQGADPAPDVDAGRGPGRWRRGLPRPRAWWLAGAAVSLAAVLWSQDRIHFVIPNASAFVAALSVCVLMAVRGLHIPERVRPVLTRLTDAGLGAFMIHILLLKTLSPSLVSADSGWLGAAGTVAALTLLTLVPSFVLSMLWGRLRLRRYLG